MNYKIETRKVAYIELVERDILREIDACVKFSSCRNQEPPANYVMFLLFGNNTERDITLDNLLSSFFLWKTLTPESSSATWVYQTHDNCRGVSNNNMVLLDYLRFRSKIIEPLLKMRDQIHNEVGPDTIIHFKLI